MFFFFSVRRGKAKMELVAAPPQNDEACYF